MKTTIDVVVPCYNEEESIDAFYKEITSVFEQVKENYAYHLIFVDDGSKDNTLQKIKELKVKDNQISMISFSRNFGKEAAIYAGLSNATAELVVLMDADLQHPPKMILTMIEEMEKDNWDVVATKRKDRKNEGIIKRTCSNFFYKIMNVFLPIEQSVQDYRLMKKQVVDSILELKEYNRFSKGIFAWCGYKVKYLPIEDIPRKYGKTKWSFRKLMSYAIEGITSFTTAPLKISIVMGAIISLLSIVMALVIIVQTIMMGKDVPGYASTIVSVLFIGGVQLLSIGILSEYVSKMYLEIKARPKYIVKEKLD